jgi:hypothetical protein
MDQVLKLLAKLYVRTKSGDKLRMTKDNLWPAQLALLAQLISGKDTLVVKARQMGISTLVAAYLFHCWLTADRQITIGIISHKLASAKHLFGIYRSFYDQLPAPVRKQYPLSIDSAQRITLAHSGATILCESTGSNEALRSFTANYIHISEYAYADNAQQLMAAAMAALAPGGQVIIESTPSHPGDPLHDLVTGDNWDCVFFPWYEHPEYVADPTDLLPTDDEQQLIALYGLTPAQLAWRRIRIGKLNNVLQAFRKEYPASLDEAWTPGDDAYFSHLQAIQAIPEPSTYPYVHHQPIANDRYAIGCDIGAGLGQDYTVVFVLSKINNAPVAWYVSNTDIPRKQADVIHQLSTLYNRAPILMERIGPGLAVLAHLEHLGANLLKEQWMPTTASQPRLLDRLRTEIHTGQVPWLDRRTLREIAAVKSVADKAILPRTRLGHCDGVIALSLSYMCLDTQVLPPGNNFFEKMKTQRLHRRRQELDNQYQLY